MKVRLTEALNTPLRFIAAGEVADLDTDEAEPLIAAGKAEAVMPAKERNQHAKRP